MVGEAVHLLAKRRDLLFVSGLPEKTVIKQKCCFSLKVNNHYELLFRFKRKQTKSKCERRLVDGIVEKKIMVMKIMPPNYGTQTQTFKDRQRRTSCIPVPHRLYTTNYRNNSHSLTVQRFLSHSVHLNFFPQVYPVLLHALMLEPSAQRVCVCVPFMLLLKCSDLMQLFFLSTQFIFLTVDDFPVLGQLVLPAWSLILQTF